MGHKTYLQMYRSFERQDQDYLSVLVNFRDTGSGSRRAKSVRIRIHNFFLNYSYIYFTSIFVQNRWDKLVLYLLPWIKGSLNGALVSVASFLQFLNPAPYPTNKSY